MAHHHRQNRNPGRQAHSPPGRSAPDHRHGHLRRRYQDARHAPRLHRAQPARRGAHQIHRHQARRSRTPASPPSSPARTPRKSGPSPAALPCPACAFRTITCWRIDRVYFIGHPVAVVVATDRYIARDAAGPDRSRLRAAAGRHRSRKGARARRARRASGMARQRRLQLITRKAATSTRRLREAEVIVKQRITSQRLIPTAMETRGVVAEWQRRRQSA